MFGDSKKIWDGDVEKWRKEEISYSLKWEIFIKFSSLIFSLSQCFALKFAKKL